MSINPTYLIKRVVRATAVASIALFLASCSASGTEPKTASASNETKVVIEGIAFEPNEITIASGETVTWVNEDEVDHTVTSGIPGKQGVPGVSEGTEARLDGLFDEALPDAGATFSFTFDEAGTFSYFCEVHASMRGVVTVR